MKKLDLVHVTQGTQSNTRYSHGNTQPLTQLPFGMAGFVPQTRVTDNHWYYHPSHRSLEGVRLTHQPSPWIGDFGALLFMPQCGAPVTEADRRWSGFRPEDAVLKPHLMKLRFLRSDTLVELVPAERGAAFRLTFGQDRPFFSVLPAGGSHAFRIEGSRLIGRTDQHTHPVPDNYTMYYAIEFDSPVNASASLSDGGAAHVALSGRTVVARLAISFISEEQALTTLRRELLPHSFDALAAQAERAWEERLARIDMEDADEDRLRTFYSCLYRLFLYPNKLHEIAEDGRTLHYSAADGAVHEGVSYTNNGFWDTFRTVYPLYSLIAPDDYREIVDGFLNIYRDAGWLPKWPSLSETGAMPGTLIDAVLADAAVKGLLDDARLRAALEGMRKHAETPPDNPRNGRTGLGDYLRHGYVSSDAHRESVNHTLDYAYGDYCLARVAEQLGDDALRDAYDARSASYKALFDPATGFLRGKDAQGRFAADFDPFAWGGDYTEAGPWQTAFAAYHDLDGLAELYGGRKAILDKLDDLFATPPVYHVGGYGFEIHEMTEMAAVNFGQCAISNQPSFHIPYLFSYFGEREKTAQWVTKICGDLFSYRPDGFPGDEDNGTTAGWYIFSALGFYPLCPGKPEYTPGIPQAGRFTVRLGNGRTLTIENRGGRRVLLNGTETASLPHGALLEGGTLVFE